MIFLRKLCRIARPFGVALGIFIAINLALSLQSSELSVARTWLQVPLPEPFVSSFALLIGAALLLPHEMGNRSWVRWSTGGIFAAFLILALDATAGFYRSIYLGRVSTDLPLPLSALFSLILLLEFIRVTWWEPAQGRLPPPAQVLFQGILVTGAFFSLMLAHVITFGHIDHRRPADAAVIFGAKIYDDGTPCDALVDRLETGIELYDRGLVGYLVMTGAQGPNGRVEPQIMKAYAERRGVPAARILLDEEGFNTRASALHCGAIARELGFEGLLAVTQYFHCARVKLIFDREGTPCYTVPTCSLGKSLSRAHGRLSRESFFLFREAVAFPFYLLYYR